MFFQIEIPTESFAADLARKWLLVVVSMHVKGQIVDLMERLVADVALIGLFATVRQLVILVVPLLMEPLAAVLADERLVIGVDAPVGVQCRASVKSFAACRTFVRLLRCVDDLVPAQGARLAKALATDLADERSSSRVNWHVSSQIIMCVEHLPTFGTGERFLFVRRVEFVVPWSGTLLLALALG